MSTRYLSAARTFVAGRRVVRKGEIFPVDDPIVSGRERLFTPVGDAAAVDTGVEHATAAPGEKRTIRRPKATP